MDYLSKLAKVRTRIRRSLGLTNLNSVKSITPRQWVYLVSGLGFILLSVTAGVYYTVKFFSFGQSCYTAAQVSSDSRCLYILGNKVFEKGTRNAPHQGHPCGTDVSSIIPSFHTNSPAMYLDPNYKGLICANTPAATNTPVPPTPTSPPAATATSAPAPTNTPVPASNNSQPTATSAPIATPTTAAASTDTLATDTPTPIGGNALTPTTVISGPTLPISATITALPRSGDVNPALYVSPFAFLLLGAVLYIL